MRFRGEVNVKAFFFFFVVFFLASSVYAQDLIILRDGNMIESKVMEISPSEIKYKRFDNLDGPTIIIDKTDVLSIRYENRSVEIINPILSGGQESGQRTKPPRPETALATDKLNVAINANPAGLLAYGPSVCLELVKGKFNSEINLIITAGLVSGFSGGIGGLVTFNRFWHRWNGGFYLGGGVGFIFQKDYYTGTWDYDAKGGKKGEPYVLPSLLEIMGLNLGYKFVLTSGLYFRTGAFLGGGFDLGGGLWRFYAKPDLTIGYCF
jgi:hypothetical protein